MLRRFWSDERGSEMLEQVATLAFIVMPALAVMMAFRTAITKEFTKQWNLVKAAL